jgi:16S rRNA (cytosine1402-N4)-methyltransferase
MSRPQKSSPHQSVLLDEAVQALVHSPSGIYVDGTFGRGGHSAEILSKLSSEGSLLAIDRDEEAVVFGRQRFSDESRIDIALSNFSSLKTLVLERNWQGKLSGVLLDLGVSSPQLDQAERGFSFQKSGPLDMRMSQHVGESAAEWVNRAEADEIADVLWSYGDERFSRRIARAILREREIEPIESTTRLADIVRSAIPGFDPKKDAATRTFQAIRIFINDELGELKTLLADVVDLLAPGGRLVVISFHSLEDRLVKRFIRENSTPPSLHRDIPIRNEVAVPIKLKALGGAIKANQSEIDTNPRSRSAVMRVAERVGGIAA